MGETIAAAAPLAAPPRRVRDAMATRADILAAAKEMFATRGYESVSLRHVARRVGVDPTLVIRYFGSKQDLFTAAASGLFTAEDLFIGDRDGFGARLAASLISSNPSQTPINPLTMMLRSANHPEAAGLLSQALDEGFVFPLAAWLEGPDALKRAGLITSLITGAAVLQFLLASRSLNGPACDLIEAVGERIQHLVDAPCPPDR